MSWNLHITQFKNYLKLERALASNSIDAYTRDVTKLMEFLDMNKKIKNPLQVTTIDLLDFIKFIHELGMKRDNDIGNLIIEFDIVYPKQFTSDQIKELEKIL